MGWGVFDFIPELLTASHIIPWSASVDQRADPRNGLCLSAPPLIPSPRALTGGGQGGGSSCFDRELLTFDLNLAVVLSKRLREGIHDAEFDCSLIEIEGKKLHAPDRFPPAGNALDYHRTRVFVG